MAIIKKGTKVSIKPQWQDAGDDLIDWIAAEDEDGGRVLIEAKLPGMVYTQTQVVQTCMLVGVN